MKSVKSKPVVSNEVMELDSEEMLPEVTLEKVIENTLIKANVTEQVISALKEKYGNLRLADIEDKEGYLDIKEARKEVRKVGILTEKLCKKGREDAVSIQKKWLAKEKEILAKIAEVEDPLNDEIEKFDNEVERKEQEAEKKRTEVYINRQTTLSRLGATYDNGSFVSNHISYEVELLKNSDEEMWNDTILPKYRKVFEEKESARVAEESKRKEELAQQKAEHERFEAEQKKFREEQELFAKQQLELQQQKEEHERQQRLAQDKKQQEEKERLRLISVNRNNQLQSLGLTLDYNSKFYTLPGVENPVNVPMEVFILDNEAWNSLIENITPTIIQRKNEQQQRNELAKEKEREQVEKEKQAAIELAAQQEREKIAEEQRQSELKKQQDAQRKQQELEAAKDKEKYAAVIEYLKKYPTLIMTSNFYKGKMNEIADFISDL